ncbi:valine--tRNA ligase [Leptolyngbya sp. BL0902]|uniref:valine--tRNA ligase n=1 Tax=Leptolyngbya sp. BL0902 TaxID=1115757 RepID=UPI0018E761D1|nr:valine--tRNA ligase [Leptolyngbya sp. BL0902]QQE64198.1 valine--tRNA ligase [Leptolyngbya sp. BL0902]
MTAPTPALSAQYDPTQTETKWQTRWEEAQVFKADPDHPGEPFCVVIPPPNVTGSLHMGHAFENALIDTIVRYQRMAGRNTLWLPGTDHASIAVATILDKQLQAEGKAKEDLGRDDYLKRAWEWKAESGGTIVNQLRKLGVSVDWSRERFTMDEGLSHAVLTAFTQLYDEGLIYRGNYMVNWCPASQSAVSDLEVEQKEVDGHLWHFRYPFTDESGYLEVATTRPETMLGDTAVAVNPNDERYKHLIGRKLRLPIVNREIPVIGDEYVDAEFGTGCVKVTPAHDPNDFAMGQRHDLPMITVMNKDGTMNELARDFEGMDRFEARKAVVQRLDDDGFLVRVEDYRHTVPYSDRGKVPVEPLLSTQWFVKIRPLADKALDYLDNHQDPRFVPERWTKVYRDWLVNLKDWCISRQLWWGHQIPAWYAISETNWEITDHTPFVVAATEEEARAKAEAQFGDRVRLERDPDVLDTWFSSGLWPFSTMGWPDESAKDLQTYYPTTTLVTGFDIIFFWVARMTLMAGHFTDKMPFETVYIHGLVRDENNKKMSKSANNGIDPLVLINKYGTDALRYTLIREVTGAGQDIRLEYDRKTDESVSVEASRNFTNKLWNASRFVMMNLGGQSPADLGAPDLDNLDLADRWILSRYNRVVQSVRNHLDAYGMGEASKDLYEFIWGDFCDWYIELVKPRFQAEGTSKRTAQQTLAFVLDGILKLLHPFMPHITEEVWHTLTQTEGDFLAVQPYPAAVSSLIDDHLEQQFTLLFNTVRTVRNLRAEAGIKPGLRIETILETDNLEERHILQSTAAYIKDLGKIEKLVIAGSTPANGPATASSAEILTPEGAEAPPAIAITVTESPTATVPATTGTPTPEQVAGEFKEFWDAIRPLLEDPLHYTNTAMAKISRPGRSVLWVLGALFALKLATSLISAIDSTPLIGHLLELIGVWVTAVFIAQNLLTAKARQHTFQTINQWRISIFGAERPKAPAPVAAEVVTPEGAAPDAVVPEGEAIPATSEPTESRKLFAGVTGTVQVLIPLTGIVDVDALRAKVEKDLGKVEAEIKSLSGRLSNAGFVDKAPAEVVQGARDALAEAAAQAAMLKSRLELL